MSKVDKRIADIKTRLIGATGRKALLVEGTDDVDAFRVLLDRRSPGWERQWLLADAGKKDLVIAMLAKEPEWLGIVDRDEWSEAEATDKSAALPNLFLLPRYCLESYLIVPEELWAAFPQKQRNKLADSIATLKPALLADLNKWIRHAAIWHAVNPLWRRLMALGFNNALLDPQDIPDDAALQARLSQWHGVMDSSTVMTNFQRSFEAIQSEPPSQQLLRWIHGKVFYTHVVHPELDRLLGQRSEQVRRTDLFKHIPLPSDLEPLWAKMELVTQ